jgi:hypothetical protein
VKNQTFEIAEEANEDSPIVVNRKQVDLKMFTLANSLTQSKESSKKCKSPTQSIDHSIASVNLDQAPKLPDVNILSQEDTVEETRENEQIMVSPKSQDGNPILFTDTDRPIHSSDYNKKDDNSTKLTVRDFVIKRKPNTSNKYFRNNAHLYQCESDLRSKGMKNLK